jgi:hypothetical protein
MRTFAPGDAESASDAALSASRTVKSGTTRVIVPSSTVVGAVASRSRDKRAYECRFERCQVGVPTCLPAVTDRRAPLHAVSWASHRSACRRNAPARVSNTLVAHHISRANQRDMIACSQSIDARARRSNVLPPHNSAATQRTYFVGQRTGEGRAAHRGEAAAHACQQPRITRNSAELPRARRAQRRSLSISVR